MVDVDLGDEHRLEVGAGRAGRQAADDVAARREGHRLDDRAAARPRRPGRRPSTSSTTSEAIAWGRTLRDVALLAREPARRPRDLGDRCLGIGPRPGTATGGTTASGARVGDEVVHDGFGLVEHRAAELARRPDAELRLLAARGAGLRAAEVGAKARDRVEQRAPERHVGADEVADGPARRRGARRRCSRRPSRARVGSHSGRSLSKRGTTRPPTPSTSRST